jgi:exosortase
MTLESPSSKKPRFRYSETGAVPMPSNEAGVVAERLLPAAGDDGWRGVWIAMAAVGVGMWFLYAVNFDHLVQRWTHDAGWSHGFVVPLIALFFIRTKWEVLRQLRPSGSMMGAAVVLAAVVGQVLFRATGVEHMSLVSLPLFFFGLVLFVFGWEYLKILWLPIGYLVFALPPPQSLYVKLTQPMQMIAAELGVQLLPLVGGSGERSGTVINVTFGAITKPLQIAEACSGMRLLVAFFALAVALGYSSNRPMWQKVTLALCALPIAILCNGLRVTLTGLLVTRVSDVWGGGDAHGFFGLTMLVPALLMQLGVAWVLDRLFVEEPEPTEGGAG